MARPRKVGKKTTIGISEHLVGWMEFAGREYAGGMTEYLMELADADRAARIYGTSAAQKDEYHRYHLFIDAIGRPDEITLAQQHAVDKQREGMEKSDHDCDSE